VHLRLISKSERAEDLNSRQTYREDLRNSGVPPMSERTQKLVSIRRRTDQDLLFLVNRELNRGFALVEIATTRSSPLFTQAEKTHGTATIWLSKVAGLSQDDRLRIEAGLKELRSRLDQVPTFAKVERSVAS
jgi:hypothetical protein